MYACTKSQVKPTKWCSAGIGFTAAQRLWQISAPNLHNIPDKLHLHFSGLMSS